MAQTNLELTLPPETAGLPILVRDQYRRSPTEFRVRVAIHENHAEGTRADNLFIELYSVLPEGGLIGNPAEIIHLRVPLRLMHILLKESEKIA